VKISVIGTGYVGLVSGVGLATVGHTVVCVDKRPEIIESLSKGVPTIYEAGLEDALGAAIAAGRLSFSLPSVDELATSDVILIAVGTPSKDGNIDLSQIDAAARLAGEAIERSSAPITVLVKSTVVPGTTRSLVLARLLEVSGRDRQSFGVGMNPEFLREGTAVADFQDPDRIVLGFEDEVALSALREMYASFDVPKVEVNTPTAELIKYANNMFLALQISASNEIANVAATLDDVDPHEVMDGVMADRRWGGEDVPPIARYLVPGPGFGGSCFPKDVEALREFGASRGVAMEMSRAILAVNADQPEVSMTGMLRGIEVDGAKALVLGLAFKTDTDDVRETPSAGIITRLQELGAQVSAHDPLAMEAFARSYDREVRYVDDWRAEVASAQVIVVPTPWRDYHADLPGLLQAGQVLVDPRRAFAPDSLPVGLSYRSIGIAS
jgi:UDPglucose 6-dehydrogenase